jgi:hypothetical protein
MMVVFQQGKVQANSISFAKLFSQALEQKNGNIYKALAATNGMLSIYRKNKEVNALIENFRGDGGDESGARYHFFGAALHTFVHEHHRNNSLLPDSISPAHNIFDPSAMVTIEETFCAADSGNIINDTVEYAVDLKGVKFGRELYRKIQGKTRQELMTEYNLNDDSCYNYEYSYTNPASTEAQTHLTSVSNMEIKDEGSFIYWHPHVRPMVPFSEIATTPGTLIYHFNFPGIIKRSKLYAPIHTFNILYAQGRGFLYASNDNVTWQQLIEVNPPERDGYNVESYNDILPDSLNGTKDLWFKIELYGVDDGAYRGRDPMYGGTIASQFSRAWPAQYPDSKVFELKVAHE